MAVMKKSNEDTSSALADIFISRVESRSPQTNPVSPKMFISMLDQGVSGEVLRPVIKHIPKGVVVRAVGSDNTNFSKLLRRKRLTGRHTEDLNDLTKLWAELREFFNWDEELVKEWISQKLPAFEGATPSEFMASHEGREIIREHLEAMRYGDFA
ncbi:MAG: hypothetical protein CML22_06975 [Rheinheimera sp.]|nr:hypothetical protein [Rheinheimera sp.]MBM34026.1 hypothetical protein [Rheinheimera sp.]|tara:strand:- start:7079 stop:7543 length:465 start_codon:yes stop_codon:yes gene_type:complete